MKERTSNIKLPWEVLILAQRTNNIHKAQPEQQKKLLKENVTKRKINRASRKINLYENQKHCQKFDFTERMECLSINPDFSS